MRISIAMATYNGARYLQEQLDSFLYQTRQPDELIVCDDGSTDATLKILESFRQQARFAVKVCRNDTNLGFIKNFEKAISLCTGDIVFLSDQDDVWFCNKIEFIEKVYTSKPDVLFTINDQIITDGNLRPKQYTTFEKTISAGLPEYWFVSGCCTSFKKEISKLILPFPSAISAHDIWISKLVNALNIGAILRLPLQYYRRHGSNTSNAFVLSKNSFLKSKFLWNFGLRDARTGWAVEAELLGHLVERLRNVIDAAAYENLKIPAENAIPKLDSKIDALTQRIAIASKPRWRRFPDLLNFYFHGGYRNFSGWKSCAKDLLRP